VFSARGTEANEVDMRMVRVRPAIERHRMHHATYHGHSEEVGKMKRLGRRPEQEMEK